MIYFIGKLSYQVPGWPGISQLLVTDSNQPVTPLRMHFQNSAEIAGHRFRVAQLDNGLWSSFAEQNQLFSWGTVGICRLLFVKQEILVDNNAHPFQLTVEREGFQLTQAAKLIQRDQTGRLAVFRIERC